MLLRDAIQPPSWVLPGARYDLDFTNNRYWGGLITRESSPRGSLMGNSTHGNDDVLAAPGSDGIVRLFKKYSLRITPGCGLWAEPDTTNYALWCRDFTNAVWSKTNLTASKNQGGATLSSGSVASSLTATAANATALQSSTVTIRDFITSCYVKRLTGSGSVFMTQDNGSTWTDIASLIVSTAYTKVEIPYQNLADPVFGFKIATSGDAIAVDFFQTENSQLSTTPMLTSASTISRGTEEPTVNTTGSNDNDGQRLIRDIAFGTPCSVYAEFSGNAAAGHVVLGGSATSIYIEGGSDGSTVNAHNQTGVGATSANTGVYGLGNVNKVTARYSGETNGCYVCLNGGAIANGAGKFKSSGTYDHMGVGNNGSGAFYLGGYIKRLACWDKLITDGQMQIWTR